MSSRFQKWVWMAGDAKKMDFTFIVFAAAL
jgi:hypothetical protein